ncbi:hypothetical protein TrRE_jg4928 [Triparma retinervis]|uniref:Calcineurin-like phosphoesterase domain-containing protein n=1 Tax=Triparma retinervis TaxID=2557542 RepID=A0A9W7F924_9STRA|nr:hypothetical protein TrRE_jg4928 [Triparma retinervis]
MLTLTTMCIGTASWILLSLIIMIAAAPTLGIVILCLPLATWLFKAILYYIHGVMVSPLISPSHNLTLPLVGVKTNTLTCIYATVFLLSFIAGSGARSWPRGSSANLFCVLFYNTFGAWVMVLVAVYAVDVVFRLAEAAGKKPGKKNKALAAWALSFTFLLQSAILSYTTPTITRVVLPVRNLSPCLSGYRICLLSDVHVGPLVSKFDSSRALDVCSEQNSDAIALSGDLGDEKYVEGGWIDDNLQPYKDFSAAEGGAKVFWTSGNHENIVGIKGWRAAADKFGIRNVENDHFVHLVEREDGCTGNISFVGIADEGGGRMRDQGVYDDGIALPDIEGAMSGLRNESGVTGLGGPVVLLSHTPTNFQKNVDNGVDVMLSGHTHGGHVFPFHFFMFSFDGSSGLFETKRGEGEGEGGGGGRGWMYVSEGVVGWGPRVRLFSRPEIAIIELTTDSEEFDREPEGDTALRVGQIFSWFSYAAVPLACLSCLVVNVRQWRGEKEGKIG